MKRILAFFLLFACTSAASAACHEHDKYGLIDSKSAVPVDQTLCREGYAVGYSYHHKAPVWVAYRLTKSSVGVKISRVDAFEEDEEIPEQHRATLADYKYSGYDRGHMAPYAAMDFNQSSGDESFLMSNMTAQVGNLNQKGWADLERFVRELADQNDEIFVVTGALFDGPNTTIGLGVHVPSDLYKVIYIPSKSKMLAFRIPNKKFDIDDLAKHQYSVNALETRSGLNFFPDLPNTDENSMEKGKVDYCTLVERRNGSDAACKRLNFSN